MIGQPNVFAILPAAKPGEAPIRTDSANAGDDTFRDFIQDAVKDSSTNQQNRSAERQERTERNATSEQNNKVESKDSRPQETTAANETKETSIQNEKASTSYQETTGTETAAAADKATPLVEQLKDLQLSQEKIDALLEFLDIDGTADLNTLLQSLVQKLNLTAETGIADPAANPLSQKQEQLLSLLKNQGTQVADLLAKAGLTEQETKNLLTKIQTLQSNQTVLQADKKTTEDILVKLSGEKAPETKSDFFSQFSDLSKQGEKSDRQAPIDKILSQSANEPAKETLQQPLEKTAATAPKLDDLFPDKNIQNNLIQTGNANALKANEGFKAPLDAKVQSVSLATDSAAKTVEGAKPVSAETLSAKGTNEARVINQIINKVSLRTNGAQNEIKIKLDPPSLGTVRMNVTTTGDSVRTVVIAENHAVKQIIENNLTQLRDSMNGQGLKIESFTVLVGGNEGQTGQQNTPQGNRSFTPGFGYGEATDFAEGTPETAAPSAARNFYFDSQAISVFA